MCSPSPPGPCSSPRAARARATGLPPASLAHFERYESNPSINTLRKVTAALHVTPDYPLGARANPNCHTPLLRSIHTHSVLPPLPAPSSNPPGAYSPNAPNGRPTIPRRRALADRPLRPPPRSRQRQGCSAPRPPLTLPLVFSPTPRGSGSRMSAYAYTRIHVYALTLIRLWPRTPISLNAYRRLRAQASSRISSDTGDQILSMPDRVSQLESDTPDAHHMAKTSPSPAGSFPRTRRLAISRGRPPLRSHPAPSPPGGFPVSRAGRSRRSRLLARVGVDAQRRTNLYAHRRMGACTQKPERFYARTLLRPDAPTPSRVWAYAPKHPRDNLAPVQSGFRRMRPNDSG